MVPPAAKPVRATKIVATLGPATDDPGVLRGLIAAGADVLRVNFSHGDHETHARSIRLARQVARELGVVLAVMQDLQGPKIRVGEIEGGAVRLREGSRVTVVGDGHAAGTAERFSVSYERLARDLRPGSAVLLDDGRIALRVEDVSADSVVCTVERGGTLGSRKGVNLPGTNVRAPALTAKDREDLRFGVDQGVDLIALSFVRRASDADAVRRAIGRRVPPIIAKLEHPRALDDLPAVLRAFDGLMVARGDLGVELSPERVPVIQKRAIALANRMRKPVITATQMLESMTTGRQPTRAEASDVANAVLDGTDAVMLSGETAVGKYPVETVRVMDRIVREAEAVEREHEPPEPPASQAAAVCHAAVDLALATDAAALAALTRSGRTAMLLSKLRPGVPVFALCEDEVLARQLVLWRDVVPLVLEVSGDADDATTRIRRNLEERSLVPAGARVVVVGAAPGSPPGRTNFIRLLTVGRRS